MQSHPAEMNAVTPTIQNLRPFRPGQSGNPSGQTRTQLRTAELTEQFRQVRRQEPSAADLVVIRSAAVLAARLEGRRRLSAEDAARCSNSLARLLKRLGIDVPPPPKPFDLDEVLSGPMPTGWGDRGK